MFKSEDLLSLLSLLYPNLSQNPYQTNPSILQDKWRTEVLSISTILNCLGKVFIHIPSITHTCGLKRMHVYKLFWLKRRICLKESLSRLLFLFFIFICIRIYNSGNTHARLCQRRCNDAISRWLNLIIV